MSCDNCTPALPPLPTYDCPRAPSAPPVNGRLDDPVWQLAPVVVPGECVTGGPLAQQTRWRLLWHGDYLYVGVQVEDTNIQDHCSRRDDAVYSEQCVEVFLQAPAGFGGEGAPERYLEADVSPTGILFDARIANPGSGGGGIDVDTAFDPEDLLVAGSLEGTVNDATDQDTGWTLVMQIPFTAPPGGCTPQPGEVWRCNLYRIHGWQEADQELQAWSQVGVLNFHVPQRFGYLRFVE